LKKLNMATRTCKAYRFYRVLVLCGFFFLSGTSLLAQDLIVTNEGDSIPCKITNVNQQYIYFTFQHEQEVRDVLLPLSDVSNHMFGFYDESDFSELESSKKIHYSQFKMGLNGGFSYQTAQVSESVPSYFEDYIGKLKSGYHLGIDLSYYMSEQLGFGVKLLLFKTSNQMDNIYVEDLDGNRRYGMMRDNLSVTFVGPSFTLRFPSASKRNALFMDMSLGYVHYRNDKKLVDDYTLNGNTAGFSYLIGYDFGITEHWLVSVQLSYLSGVMTEYEVDSGEVSETVELKEDEYESLNRLDFSVGLRFRL